MDWLIIILGLISKVLRIYYWVLLIYIFMSWVPNIRMSAVGQLFARVCEPFLEPFRRIIPPIGGVIDISPWAAFIVLMLANQGIYQIIYTLG